MTLTASDLGVLTDLATALGIVRDGSTDPSWFGDPAAHLGRVLADDGQRQALVSFLDTVLDDGSVEADDDGRVRLPIVTHDDPDLTVAVVLEPRESRQMNVPRCISPCFTSADHMTPELMMSPSEEMS